MPGLGSLEQPCWSWSPLSVLVHSKAHGATLEELLLQESPRIQVVNVEAQSPVKCNAMYKRTALLPAYNQLRFESCPLY